VVVANKVDGLPGAQEAIQELQRSTPLPVVPVSAQQGVGLDLLRAALQQLAPPQLEA
jgi:50S ribosomal subunit-associated GTPase HflX